MGTQTSPSQHVFRQRSPLALAVVCGAIGLVLLVSMAWQWADDPQPLFAAWVLFGLALLWSLFVRPAVLLDDEGVTIRNVIRDIRIPWVLVTSVESRWSLKVFVGDRGYTSWAISSQLQRAQGAPGGMSAILPRRVDQYARADAKPSMPAPKVSAQMVGRSIEQAMDEYAEAVARGAIAPPPDPSVRITWVPLVIAILSLSALAVVALSRT